MKRIHQQNPEQSLKKRKIIVSMQEKKKEHIDRLLTEINKLEERVLTVKRNDAVPFSFISDAFTRLQEMERLLHSLDTLQIEEMKLQMQRMVAALAESGAKNQADNKETPASAEGIQPATPPLTGEHVYTPEEEPLEHTAPRVEILKEETMVKRNRYAEGITLPEYINPRMQRAQAAQNELPVAGEDTETEGENPSAETATLSAGVPFMKRRMSLNDRFLFQRELFHGDREKMNTMMLKLEAFESPEEAENYLREHTSWDFDHPVVKDFLRVAGKNAV
ncbi:MAG TPA: hypothetical protein DDZ78_16950 [Porphyromonadaceae bacterium]|nr:hypothetical protein [Porphyromonadaceae bacterium]HBK33292.1 hypothetical protein [Porphyromonadaceae bacterium]